jgi:hypothetical protein
LREFLRRACHRLEHLRPGALLKCGLGESCHLGMISSPRRAACRRARRAAEPGISFVAGRRFRRRS